MAILPLSQAFGGGAGDGGQQTQSAPSTGQPNIVPLTQAFAPQSQQSQPSQADAAMGGTTAPTPLGQMGQPWTGAPRPATQPRTGAPLQSGPEGPSTLDQIGGINSLIQQAGKIGNSIVPGLTKDIGGTGFNLSDIGGPISLARGITNNNVGQTVGGALSTAGTLGRVAATALDMPGLGTIGNTVASLGGPLSLAMAIKNKDPIGIASGLFSTYGAASNAIQQLGGSALPGLSTAAVNALAQFAPQTAAAIANIFGGGAAIAADAGTTAISAALSASLAGVGAVAAPVIMAITSWISNNEEMNARNAGWRNNPIKGQLSSNATAGVARANQTLDKIDSAGGVEKMPTNVLMQSVPDILNSVMPYYATAQGGRGAIRASDTVTGGTGDSKSSGQGADAVAQYTSNFTQAQSRITDAVQSLLKRGVSYEDLGKLPVSNAWADPGLDMSNPKQQFYDANAAKFNAEGAQILQKAMTGLERSGLNGELYIGPGLDPNSSLIYGPDTLTPQMLFKVALGTAQDAPDSVSHAGGLMTAMFGGPLWTAMARMGAGGPDMQKMIQEHFDPWAVMRTFSPEQLRTALAPFANQANMVAGESQQAFTSGP